jgi:protein-tyrosine phosphatase
MLDDITPEENERRFKECMEWIHDLTREKLVKVMGEE